MALSATMLAQQSMPVPFDQNVRRGKLENGLTYYIRHNEKPAQRANFYIAQKVAPSLKRKTNVVSLTSWSTWPSTAQPISLASRSLTIWSTTA